MTRPSNASPTTLASLKHGDRALILDIAEGNPVLGAKLAARGLVPGAEIDIVRAGDPLLLAVDESRWAVTRNDANKITVDAIRTERTTLLKRIFRR